MVAHTGLEPVISALRGRISRFVSGTNLGRYEIRSKIGEGGMGEVYLAQDMKLNRNVALKILPANVADDRDRMNRFVREARAASALNHPNIITIHEIDHTDSIHFIATEFIDGETLRQRIQSAPMKLGEALDVAAQIASALSAAHYAGIVHRDIKPENVMRRRDGIVKVLDFGLAKLTELMPHEAVDSKSPPGGYRASAKSTGSSDQTLESGYPLRERDRRVLAHVPARPGVVATRKSE